MGVVLVLENLVDMFQRNEGAYNTFMHYILLTIEF